MEELKMRGSSNRGQYELSLLISVIFLLGFVRLSAQQIVENPDKPLAKNAGRVLKLQEVWRISDESGQFFFKGIYSLKIGDDGTIFIFDQDQLLKFSADGKFINNLLKKGQGPGEISRAQYSSDIKLSVAKNDLYIYDNNARKIVHTDWNGAFIEEFRPGRWYSDFLGRMDDRLVFIEQEPVGPGSAQTTGFHDLKFFLFLTALDGTSEKEILALSSQIYQQPRMFMGWAPFETALNSKDHFLYSVHTAEYKIDQVDLKEGRIARSFNRKYPRVDHVVMEYEKEFIKKYDAPVRKYEYDISLLYLNNNGDIWAKTSTKNDKKWSLIDVFNPDGKFVDSFFVPTTGAIAAVRDDCIFCSEQDADGNLRLVKYKITG
jgi:hypothetical protein